MSLQDRMEQILKNIHLLFSECKPYDEEGEWIIVKKEMVFEQLQQLNLIVYEMMDTYEMTKQKQQLAQRRCEKRGEEIIQKASNHADDIYAASIMYTDDAINRICHIMEDANDSVRKVFNSLNNEMERERERVRHNQLELTSQLQDFADTNKYIKLIEEINKKLERERMEEEQAKKEKRIQNEGKSYPSSQPEIHVNEEYLERRERHYNLTPLETNVRKEEEESLARVTGREFAESLRRRAAKSRKRDMQVEDMSGNTPVVSPVLDDSDISDDSDALNGPDELPELKFDEVTLPPEEMIFDEAMKLSEEEAFPKEKPEIHVDLDAEYFKWKEENGREENEKEETTEKKGLKSLFGRKS